MSPKQGVRNPPSSQEGLQALKDLLEERLIEIVGYNEDGEPLYDIKK